MFIILFSSDGNISQTTKQADSDPAIQEPSIDEFFGLQVSLWELIPSPTEKLYWPLSFLCVCKKANTPKCLSVFTWMTEQSCTTYDQQMEHSSFVTYSNKYFEHWLFPPHIAYRIRFLLFPPPPPQHIYRKKTKQGLVDIPSLTFPHKAVDVFLWRAEGHKST